jgi:hypothetical protein
MALNGELRAAGAHFLRAVNTEPTYQLYALSGGPPERPGLVRVAADVGHAIATEVWALPAAGFGRFVAGIPAPLAIGTLQLADGSRPKGFLCEAEAIRARAMSPLLVLGEPIRRPRPGVEADQDNVADDDPRVPPCPCPRCGARMIIIETFEAGCQPINRPTAPKPAAPFDTS